MNNEHSNLNMNSLLNIFLSRKGGSVANTARVASVVVGEFRDPGDNQ